jgi:hypothetical protein
MIRLLCRYNEAAVIVDADQKPVLLALNLKWFFEVYLPKYFRCTSPKEFPALKFMLVAVLIVP